MFLTHTLTALDMARQAAFTAVWKQRMLFWMQGGRVCLSHPWLRDLRRTQWCLSPGVLQICSGKCLSDTCLSPTETSLWICMRCLHLAQLQCYCFVRPVSHPWLNMGDPECRRLLQWAMWESGCSAGVSKCSCKSTGILGWLLGWMSV